MPPRKRKPDGPTIEFIEKRPPVDYSLTPGAFIEENLQVVDGLDTGRIIPFKLNPGQEVFIRLLEKALRELSYVRMIVLKSRRQGISTICEAIMYWIASCRENANTLVLAHDKDTSTELFRIAQGFYENDARHASGNMPLLQEISRAGLRFGNPNKNTRHLEPGLRSAMLVETAEGRGVARGFTLAGYHWAEVAYTKKQEVATGLNIACSRAPGTVGIWESTANGVGDAFEDTWKKAVEGKSEFVPVFLPWNIDPRCTRPLTLSERSMWQYRSGERELMEKYGLSLEQLKFRRITIESPECYVPGVDPADVFAQEYPLCWEEAFLKRGRNFFSIASLNTLKESEKGVRDPDKQYMVKVPLNNVEIATRKDHRGSKLPPVMPVFLEAGHGPFWVWEHPVDGEDYVVAGDAAEGLQHGDNSIAIVLARRAKKVVARYASKALDPDEFGLMCACIGWYYNTALVGIERNGPGVAANKVLRDIKYPRAWYERDLINVNEPVKSFMGWSTSVSTRRPMLDRLEEAVRNLEFGLPSSAFYEEARNFILSEYKDASGVLKAKPVAAPGHHDDEILATAIAVQLHIHGGIIKGDVAGPKKSGVDIYKPQPRPEKKPKPQSDYEFRNDWYDIWDK